MLACGKCLWSAKCVRVVKASVSFLAAKYWNVPMRRWLDATRVNMPPWRGSSLMTFSPDDIAARARVVGMPRANMASLMRYSRMTGPSADLPSPPLENGVLPEPLSWMSFWLPLLSMTSPRRTALPSPSWGEKPPNW